jgi:glutathione S-transferase
MTLLLYERAGVCDLRVSPYCWRARLALEHKGLEAESIPIFYFETKKVPFRNVGNLPVLSDNGRKVEGTWEIADHLDKAYPDRPALMRTPEARSMARFMGSWADNVLVPGLMRVVLPDFLQRLHVKDREYYRQSREAWVGATVEQMRAKRTTYMADLCCSLAPLRSAMSVQTFLGGDAPSYADYVPYTAFVWAWFASEQPVLAEDDPLQNWLARMQDRFEGLPRSLPAAA